MAPCSAKFFGSICQQQHYIAWWVVRLETLSLQPEYSTSDVPIFDFKLEIKQIENLTYNAVWRIIILKLRINVLDKKHFPLKTKIKWNLTFLISWLLSYENKLSLKKGKQLVDPTFGYTKTVVA